MCRTMADNNRASKKNHLGLTLNKRSWKNFNIVTHSSLMPTTKCKSWYHIGVKVLSQAPHTISRNYLLTYLESLITGMTLLLSTFLTNEWGIRQLITPYHTFSITLSHQVKFPAGYLMYTSSLIMPDLPTKTSI